MGVLSAVLGVFGEIGTWIVEIIPSLTGMFWETSSSGGSFTFLGVLSCCGLGVSVILLFLNIIRGFLHFR